MVVYRIIEHCTERFNYRFSSIEITSVSVCSQHYQLIKLPYIGTPSFIFDYRTDFIKGSHIVPTGNITVYTRRYILV